MDESGPNESRQPSTEKSEENNEQDQHTDGDAIAENQEQTTDFVILDIDCIEDAFEYWPIEDVDAAGKRLKRLKNVAGFFIIISFVLFVLILLTFSPTVEITPSYSSSS